MTASATSTSISVNPPAARRRPRSQRAERDNIHTSRQPVDADLIADTLARERDGPAAGHAGCKEADRGSGAAVAAAGGKRRVEDDVFRHLNGPAGGTGADRAGAGIDRGGDFGATPHGGDAV